jgi:transposase InsO family protein
MLESVYYDPRHEAAFGTLDKLKRAVSVAKPGEVKQWLEQDAYTLHRSVRKRFPRNPYSVNNILDVWECDLVDVQTLSRHNDGYRYLLTVIDVFSKYIWSP